MSTLVFVLGAIYVCICFAPNIYKCMESSVDVYYTRDLFHFRWDWKADRISVAETNRMESKKIFTPMPLDPREWPKWLQQDLSHESAEIQLSTKIPKKLMEPYSLHSIYLMGMCWKQDVALWDKPSWDRYTLQDLETNSNFTPNEKEFMEKEWKKQYFKDYDLHYAAQRQFLGLLRVAVQSNPEITRLMAPVFKKISVVDFLQGSRALIALRGVIGEVVESEIPVLQTQALGLGKAMVAESKTSYEEISARLDELERIVELSRYSVDATSEARLVRHFVSE